MKKSIFLLTILAIVVSTLLVACSQSSTPPPSSSAPPPISSAPAPTTSSAPPAPQTSTPPATSTTTTATKPITITVSTAGAENSWNITHALLPWLKEISDATNGKVQFQVYYNGTLAPVPQQWQAVASGVADSSLLTQVTYASVTPLANVITLPFLNFTSHEQASGILQQVIDKYPSVAAEFNSTHLVTAWVGVQDLVMSSKKVYKTLDDWKGVKIRTGGGTQTMEFQALGADPTSVPVSEAYIDMQKGVFDAATGQWDFIFSFKMYEVAKYYTYAPFSTSLFSFPINNDLWNSFSPDIKAAFNKYGGVSGAEFWGYNMFDTITQQGPEIIKKEGYPLNNYTVPHDELAKWEKVAGEPVYNKWVQDETAQGHPEAKDILNTVQSLTKTYNPAPPAPVTPITPTPSK